MNSRSTSNFIRALSYSGNDFHHLVRKIVSESHLDRDQACEVLGVDRDQFISALDAGSPRSLAVAIRACEKLNISLDQLIEGRIDWDFARLSFREGHKAVPERYREAGLSRIRSIQNILSFIDAKFGEEYRNLILRKLQLHSNMFRNPNGLVNMRLAIDLVNTLENDTGTKGIGYQIGLHSPSLKLSSYSQVNGPKNANDAYSEFFSKSATQVEANRAWRIISQDRKKILVESVSNRSVVETIEQTYLKSVTAETIRLGYLAAIPVHYGLPQARALIERQISESEQIIIYRIAI